MTYQHSADNFAKNNDGGRPVTKVRGFTLIEVMLVCGVAIIISAISVPPIMKTVILFKLRSSSASVASLIQETRMHAVRDNAIYTMRATTTSGASLYYIDLDQNSTYRSGEEPIQLAQGVQVIAENQVPAPLPVAGTYTQDAADPVSFNSRGLPCQTSAPNVCSTLPGGSQIGFVYYLVGQALGGQPVYRAVSVTPAGRVRIFSYSGGTWQ